MENSTKDRYIYAVVRHLPTKMKKDVEMELDSLITEMLNERQGDETNIQDVLKELGRPEELALKYYGSERKALISGVYYLMYKRVLNLVLPIVAIALAIITTIGLLVGDYHALIPNLFVFGGAFEFTAINFVSQVIGATVGAVVQAFAIITVVFAVMEHFNVDLKEGGIVENLPEIPEEKHTISPIWPFVGIIVSITLTALFLGFPQIAGILFEGEWIPALNIGVVRGMWFPIIAWAVFEIIVELVKMVEGRYTMRLAGVSVICGILCAVCAVAVFGRVDIVSPDFLYAVESMATNPIFDGIPDFVPTVISRPQNIILSVMLVVIAIETIDIVVTAFQARRG